MIVDPDFMDHWKTRMLVDSLGFDEAAPVYVLRLWAHCQNRRKWEFEGLSAEALRAICRFKGDAELFEASMSASGFVERTESTLIVVGWEIYNSTLIAAWSNGKKGGRPVKQPKNNPRDTHGIPTGKPIDKPTGIPQGNRLDEIGLDQKREEDWSSLPDSENAPEGQNAFLTAPNERTEKFWAVYPKKTQKGPLQAALDLAVTKECSKRGITDEQAFTWIYAAAMEYSMSPVGKPPSQGNDMRPSPARWLNDERYSDDRAEWLRPNGDARKPNEKQVPRIRPIDTSADDAFKIMNGFMQ